MKNIFQNLRRRNVPKAAISYLAISWAIVEAASIIFPTFSMDKGFMRNLMIILAIGFPFWVIFAYVFEWTPRGFKKTTDVQPEKSLRKTTSKRLSTLIFGGMAMAIILLVSDRVFNFTNIAPADSILSKSIAVLPFENIGREENAYFTSGVTEDILTQISKIRDLRVLSRFTLRNFEPGNKTIKQIGDELGVGFLLTGSIQRSGDDLRISCQLVKVNPEEEIWAENFDKSIEDVFAIQNEVAIEVAKYLRAELSEDEKYRIQLKPTENLLAYNFYLKGREAYYQYTPEGNKNAYDYFKEAVNLDPDFGLAWAGLADAINKGSQDHSYLPSHYIDSIYVYALKATSLAPTSAEPFKALAVYYYAKGEYEKAIETLKVAIKNDPNHLSARANLALIMAEQGKLSEAIDLYQKCISVNPTFVLNYSNIANRYLALSMYDEAEKNLAIGSSLDPESWHLNMVYAYLYMGLNDQDRAEYHVRFIQKKFPKSITLLEYSGEAAKDFNIDLANGIFNQIFHNPEFDPDDHPITMIGLGHIKMLENKKDSAHLLLNSALNTLKIRIDSGNQNNLNSFFIACIYSIMQNNDESLKWLERAFKEGFFYDHPIRKNAWLQNLSQDERFNQLIIEHDKRVEKIRNEIRAREQNVVELISEKL